MGPMMSRMMSSMVGSMERAAGTLKLEWRRPMGPGQDGPYVPMPAGEGVGVLSAVASGSSSRGLSLRGR